MLTFVYLSEQFYKDFGHCEHILKKKGRPYVRALVNIDGVAFCAPLRSNINHPYALWTDKQNKCGIDFGNTVAIADTRKYIDTSSHPIIRQNEFDALRGKEREVERKLLKYISDYRFAKQNMRIPRCKSLVEHSSLQYFDDLI